MTKYEYKIENLPELIGSEKQVVWAKQIRETRLAQINEKLEWLQNLQELVKRGEAKPDAVAKNWANAMMKYIPVILDIKEAKFWIETREGPLEMLAEPAYHNGPAQMIYNKYERLKGQKNG